MGSDPGGTRKQESRLALALHSYGDDRKDTPNGAIPWPGGHTAVARGAQEGPMSVDVRPASLQDGVAVLSLLEDVGYYPEPVSFARTFRRTITDPHFLVRVAEAGGRIVGLATLSLRYQLGLGGLLACLDEFAVVKDAPKGVERALRRETLGRARALGAVRVLKEANQHTPPPRASQLRARAAAAASAAPVPQTA